MKTLAVLLVLLAACLGRCAEVMPPAPANHFNDYAGVISPAVSQQLDRKLADFERQTSSQVVAAIFRKMQSDSSIEDYTVRIAQSWHVGQKGKDNGVVLFVFVDDHKMFIQTGYGMEGALPDALCKRIIQDEMAPRFRNGDFDGGLTAGLNAILAATKGEYHGTGQTVADRNGDAGAAVVPVVIGIIVFIIIINALFRGLGGGSATYSRGGYNRSNNTVFIGGWGGGGGWGSGGGGGGFSGGGGGGGFSGGGGSFGGGGAGGSW